MTTNELREVVTEFKKLGDTGRTYLEKIGGIHCTTFCANNPYQTAYNEGRRSIVLHILSLLKTDELKITDVEKDISSEYFSDSLFDDYWR